MKAAPNTPYARQKASAAIASRRDQKHQRREQHLVAQRQQAAQAQRRRWLILAAGTVAGVALVAVLGLWLAGSFAGSTAGSGRVQTLPLQGSIHIQRGANHPDYNSTPPTSGWHYGDAVAPWGIAANPIPNEVQVHNLEHGGIMIQYDCPTGCPEMVSQLEAIVRTYPSKVILAPYPGINHPIALTAWTKLAYLDTVDEALIRKFIADYKNKGPEQVPD